VSTIKVDTVQSTGGGAVTLTNQHAAKAWANYGAESGTPSTNQSFNISSVDDEGAGDFDFNFSNTLSAVGSGFNVSARYSNGDELATQTGARVFTTHVSVKCGSNTTSQTDHYEGNVGVLGDLA
tara:strand:+ start:148 stop:519 length:372 start_codon:yes stop_codon:yes gene_type:complete